MNAMKDQGSRGSREGRKEGGRDKRKNVYVRG